ncbi:hypothetical protein M231_00645 [Tremella mesenterica]|uniref:Uncharacterized protein n=1 Tax=Tremella mesenterica TaxID=5217 RepID=A0A4Q1BUV6_TREME|nr:hypothetical protein M231_00645 [Tremella mesenterica]
MGRQKLRKDRRPPPRRPTQSSQTTQPLQPWTDQTNLPYLAPIITPQSESHHSNPDANPNPNPHLHSHSHSHSHPHPHNHSHSHSHTHTHNHDHDHTNSHVHPPTQAGSSTNVSHATLASLGKYAQAVHDRTARALNKVDRLSEMFPPQAQLEAIASAAAGLDPSVLDHPGLAAAMNGQTVPGMTDSVAAGGSIDLPSSLAALFEAKLTLDREKAKLVKMQKELKGYKEDVASMTKTNGEASGSGSGSGSVRASYLCTCGQEHHYDSEDEYYEYSDEECSGDCMCNCHEIQNHSHPHSHSSAHIHPIHEPCSHHASLEYVDEEEEEDDDEDEEEMDEDQAILLDSEAMAEAARFDGGSDKYDDTYPTSLDLWNGKQETRYRSKVKSNEQEQTKLFNDVLGKMAVLRELEKGKDNKKEEKLEVKMKPLSEDPERLEEAVKELFNWIKAVVWTIEQAALVAGRRKWAQQAK